MSDEMGMSEKASSRIREHLSTLRDCLWTPSMGAALPLLKKTDILIGVMGMTGVGKTTFIKQITDLDMKIGHGLQSCTKEMGLATTQIGNSIVRFIDTPGFDDTDTKDSDILKAIWEHISNSDIEGGDLRLSGLLYLHRITDDRVGGTALKNLSMFKKLVGDRNMSNVILVTTMWGKLQPSDDGEARVKELTETGKFWGGMIGCGANHQRYDGTQKDALRIVNLMLEKVPCKLQIQEELDTGTKLADTAAGKEVGDRLEALSAEHAQQVAELKEQLHLEAQKGNQKVQQELQAMYKRELEQQQEIAEAQKKLQEAETEALKQRVVQLESKGGCVVC